MVIKLNADTINAMDVSGCPSNEPTFFTPVGVTDNPPYGSNHYRLLCYFSSIMDGVLFADIGTSGGDSAIALGSNPKNRVISFDIVNVRYHTMANCLYLIEDYWNHKRSILGATVILYDIPHMAGRFPKFCKFLRYHKWDGFLILDDFHYDSVKQAEWDSLGEDYPKFDATKYGHSTGTGIVNFSQTIQFEME